MRDVNRSALISECWRYRYRLDRDYAPLGRAFGPRVAFIMVNPSTADAFVDDATIRKVAGFAARHGFYRVTVGNLFAYRATDVRELRNAGDAVGPENDEHLRGIVRDSQAIIYAWGPLAKQPRALRDRWRAVDAIVREQDRQPLCLGTAKDGHPRHPLMLAYSEPLVPWSHPNPSEKE
jgi:hypothetical protein